MSVQSIPPVFPPETFYVPRVAARPTARAWARHAALFLLTALTATFAGVTLAVKEVDVAAPNLAAPAHWFDYAFYVPAYYALTVASLIKHALAHPTLLAQGATFAGALLSILLAHEFGHYVACRRYGVEATLPYFLPAPPLFLAGTFGAFIKIKSPIPTRRALFDIGVAGPLAGFVVIIPVAIAAVLTARPEAMPTTAAGGLVIFNDPPLLHLLGRVLHVSLDSIAFNPFYFAAWIGLLVTSLNLLPVGQLDGGHAVFAVAGARVHRLIGRGAFVSMCVLAFLGWRWHGAPSGFVYALLLFIMLRVRHPQAEDERAPLGRARLVVTFVTLVVFLLCFELFPLTIT
jgi:membrane-associated protease RseP (regulator of RpoE activity)